MIRIFNLYESDGKTVKQRDAEIDAWIAEQRRYDTRSALWFIVGCLAIVALVTYFTLSAAAYTPTLPL